MSKKHFKHLNLIILVTFASCSGITRLQPCELNDRTSKNQFKVEVYKRLVDYYAQKTESSLVKIISLNCDDYLSKEYIDSAAFSIRVKPQRESKQRTDIFIFDKELNILKVYHELPKVY